MSVVANVAINVDAANAVQQLNRVKQASAEVQGEMQGASASTKGFSSALMGAIGQLGLVATALAVVQKGLNTAFERDAAEQRFRNLTSSTGEFNAAMALAADTSAKFGITQTESTKALADVYSRLKGVGFGLQETGQIYQGFNAIVLQSGLAGEEAASVFFQLSQALGKGKLNGDEFVTIAEKMPQLLDAIAQTTGKSRGELQGMAQDGKITSQVLYEALSGAANASGNLNNKLTAQQQTFNNLRQVSDQLLNSIGQVFAPVVVAGAQALAQAGQMLSNWWDYIGGVVFPKVYDAIKPVVNELQYAFRDLNFDDFRIFLQNVMIKGLEYATGVLKGLSTILAQVINAFRALAENPAFKFIAEQVGKLAEWLGLTTDKVGEFKSEQDNVTKAATETVAQYSSLPAKIDDAKKETELFKQEVDAVKLAYEGIRNAQDEGLNRMENTMKISQERIKAEQAVNNAIKEQLQSQLEQAKTQEQRVQIAQSIYEIEIANARSTLAIALQQIDYEIRRSRIAAGTQALKVKELQTELALAQARNQNTVNLETALTSQQSAFKIAMQNARAIEQTAVYQRQQAQATFQSQEFAAKLAYQQNITAKETAKAATSADDLANGMERAGAAAEKTAQAVNKISLLGRKSQGAPFAAMGGAEAIQDPELQKQAIKIFEEAQKFAGSKDYRVQQDIMQRARDQIAQLSFRDYAARTKAATLATSPNLTPASLPVPSDTQQTASGLSMQPGGGSSTAVADKAPSSINIQTGPVMQQGGQNYVTMQDFERGLQGLANQLLSSNRTNGGRRYAGVR